MSDLVDPVPISRRMVSIGNRDGNIFASFWLNVGRLTSWRTKPSVWDSSFTVPTTPCTVCSSGAPANAAIMQPPPPDSSSKM